MKSKKNICILAILAIFCLIFATLAKTAFEATLFGFISGMFATVAVFFQMGLPNK